MAEAHRVGLLAEVGVLAAGHFVFVDFGGAGARRGIKGLIEAENLFPVVGNFVERIEVQARVTVIAREGCRDGVEVWLRGRTRHRRDREIDDVHACFGSGEYRCGVDARGVVGVEMHGDADLVLQRADQFPCSVRFAKACHVLDAEHVGTHAFDFLGFLDVVLEGILVAALIGDVAGVADRGFADGLAVVTHRFHRHLHVR